MMMRILFALVLAVACGAASADDRQACGTADGSFLTGQVVGGPRFVHGQFRQGVELSHTHLNLRADQDGRVYDVAIDNVFANGYRQGETGVPAPIDTIRAGDHLELCGQLYSQGVGIHFVHDNCGAAPSANHPDGWLKLIDGSNTAGPNLEAATRFCGLFGQSRGHHRRN